MTLFSRRSLVLSLGALATLSACGQGDADPSSSTPASSTGGAGEGATDSFPVTLTHALGTATIESEPQRIVTLGQGSTETVVALGIVPVGVEKYDWAADKNGHLPWVSEAITKLGKPLPPTFAGMTELDIEKIIELEPDLILAPWSGITAEQYGKLSDIAPTVAYPKTPWTIGWKEQITTVCTALGRSAEATKLIEGISKEFAKATSSRPAYKGKTFSYIYNTGPGTLGVFMPHEQRVQFVSSCGLTVDPFVTKEKEVAGTASAVIGLENADKLKNSDLVFTFYTDAASRKKIEAQPLYAAIPAVKRGAVVAFTDNQVVTAASIITPLTVPWVMTKFLSGVDAAVAKSA